MNLAQLATTEDNKTCYIAQPVGGYNYALVNGMPLNQGTALGIATVDAQGRIQIVNQNKPIAAVSCRGLDDKAYTTNFIMKKQQQRQKQIENVSIIKLS